MQNSIESVLELALHKSSRDTSFDFGSQPGEPRFNASSDLGESGGEQAGAGDDSFPSLDELRENIVSTLDASIVKFSDLLSRRGIVQQPRLFKLSDELLGLILGFLAEPQLCEPLPTIYLQSRAKRRQRNEEFIESVKAIQSLRFVCRRICNVSSVFLLPTVRVELSAQSLARLDMISRHPTIGKGVRTVRVITRCLDRMPIDSFENFRHHKSEYLSEALDGVVSDDEGEEFRMSCELYRRYILNGSGNSINESILHNGPFVFDGSDGIITDKNLRQIFWSKAYGRYKYLHAEQEILSEEGVFLEGVGTAVARMPRATTLHLCDRGGDDFYDYNPHPRLYSTSKLLFDYYENEDVLIDDIIKSKLFGGEDENNSYLGTDTSWNSPSAQILLRLPGAIHKAGRSLENICIEIECPSDHRTLASFEDFQELSAATQRLKQFTFYCTYDEDDEDEDDQWTPTELDGLVKYLSAIVNTNALEKIDINLSHHAIGLGNFDMEEQNPSVPSLGTILTSRIWPNLKSIYLSRVPLHLSELETFIDNLKSLDVEMNIQYMYLISGSWSDGLETFKRNLIQNLVLREPISRSECRALLSSGKLFWDWDKGQFYWDCSHSLLKTRTSDY
ncbi:uncharacterized protein Bfra_006688 [Botrytis fragariae]|uniref:Uncharacterized protein n=1 Tax=Botrytis fragariae TaxID=1964551 RepID=A0A8H6EPJ2_9HELO|nr:uncharacterized protein Bfra_006688 [Botrytis fragariae]KAF5879480.1 hypothetical protein Bfra_006688 [Botrytis fragariae]